MGTVRAWAQSNNFEYRFVDDRLFDYVPEWFRRKASNICTVTDLARLKLARELLDHGYERTVWIDADMLVFAPERLTVEVGSQFALCHEVWVYADDAGQPAYAHRVNNSICVFIKGNVYLDFFMDACEQIARSQETLGKLDASIRFMSQLHSILPYPLLLNVGMFSPALMADIASDTQRFLPTYAQQLMAPLACANLCASLVGQPFDGAPQGESRYEQVIARCLATRGEVVNRFRQFAG